MFRPEGALPSTIVVLLLLFVTSHCQSNSRSYDTNDWIPVSRPCPTCYQNSDSQPEAAQKKPTGRVLNLPATDQKRFFPEDQSNPQLYQTSGKQYTLTEGTQQTQPIHQRQQPSKLPDVTAYVPGGHVVLPPQLQNLISQGQPLLSPQRINSQLLQDAPTQQAISSDQFHPNVTQYSPRDFDNIYDQRLIQKNPQLQQHRNIQPNFQQLPKQQSNNGPEEVQLLYVPLENLRPRGQKVRGQQINFPAEQTYQPVQSFNLSPPPQTQQFEPSVPHKQQTQQFESGIPHKQQTQQFESSVPHKQVQLHNIQQDFVQQALQAQKLQQQLQQNIQQIPPPSNRASVVQEANNLASSSAPKKRKPHQPPLAVYMGTDGQEDVKITDVLALLKDAKSISVQDSVGPDSPQVFVGPSQLEAPDGYVKFDLPYLSSIEGNRVERKVDQLPFFVAPLSYKAPSGYSKIPFPAPHVGSVVVNHMKELEEQARREAPVTTEKSIVPEITEAPTARPRIRQRLPSRVAYPSSSIPPPPNSGDIPLSKEVLPVQSETFDDSVISSNPYGPTQFIQTTTSSYEPDDNPIPEQLFSTYGRLTTATSYKNQETASGQQQQYIPSPKQQLPTESPTSAPTHSGIVTNDKFTVLEQFPVPNKQSTEKYQQENIPHRVKSQHHQLRGHQNEEFINNFEKPAQQLLYNNNKPTEYIEQYQSAVPPTHFDDAAKYVTGETFPNEQTYFDQYNTQTAPQFHNRNQHRAASFENVQQPVLQQQHVLHGQTHAESPVNNINAQNRQRGRPQFTPDTNFYVDQYTTTRPIEETVHYTVPSKQTLEEINEKYNIQQTPAQQIRTQPIRTRGRQHFTPQPDYSQEYEGATETVVRKQQPVTKASTSDYNVQISTQLPVNNEEETHHSAEPYYQAKGNSASDEEQGYILPVQLPAISPHLPGLVNSLEDQAIRPLLAPLLIPPSEQTPSVDSTSEHYTYPVTSTSTTTTTTTPAPIIETTTQTKRLRSRNRGTRPTFSEYTNTTPSSRRPSQYRGRRPYSGRTKTEHIKPTQYLEEVTPTTNILHQEIPTEAPVRTNVYAGRNRFAIQRDHIYGSSTTDLPRRGATSSRQRFRTRGRPAKSEDDYNIATTKSTTDNLAGFKQPELEGGFQASAPVVQNNAYLPNVYSQLSERNKEQVVIQKPQQPQAVAYIPNTKQSFSENVPVHINEENYNSREIIASTSKPISQKQETSIPVSAPENNIVGDVIHVDPAYVQNQVTSQVSDKVKYTHNLDANPLVAQYTPVDEVSYNSRETQYVNIQPKVNTYHETYVPQDEPEPTVVTTETSRVRTRTRNRQRTRGHSTGNTVRHPVHQQTTTTTARTTTQSKDDSEEEEEFYGFFRQPDFVKPVEVEYKQSSELRNPQRALSNVAYLSREQDDQPVYINTAQTSEEVYEPVEYSQEANVLSNIPSTTAVPATTIALEETTVEIKPVTRRPTTNFIRSRRPTTVTQSPRETSTRVSDKYYTVRPSKRPDSQTPKITRIRGRIRKPTRPTTTTSPPETEVPYVITHKPIHVPKQLHIPTTTHEHITPARQRQRLHSRGRTHFQYTSNKKHLSGEEPESPNYPASFLQAHGLPTPKQLTGSQNLPEKPDISSQETVTPRPTFQLTIEPDDVDEEYADQIPFSSVSKPKLSPKDLEDGAESQFSAKIVEKPTNYNFVQSEEKNASKADDASNNQELETSTEVQLQVTTVKADEPTTRADLMTETPTTVTAENETEKPKRKGFWRLVNQRPVSDDFESAESQHIGTVYSNNLYNDEKPERKYNTIQRVKSTTSSFKDITTIIPETTTASVNSQLSDSIISKVKVSKPEDEMLAPLYEMFGLDYDSNKGSKIEQQSNLDTTTQFSTTFDEYPGRMETTTNNDYNSTAVTEVPNASEDETLVYSDQNRHSPMEWVVTDEAWKSRIIGTSTTTEVSHETEICYRGRCVKSTSENSSEV